LIFSSDRLGGEEGAALAAAEAALGAGKSLVTANKALLAKHGMRLAALAEEKGVALAFEASVAGGIPVVKTLREGLAGNSIERVYGILNGTRNYILTRMESEGLTFAQCLGEAQKLGYLAIFIGKPIPRPDRFLCIDRKD
jgi:homoserine dehydrogenase